MNINILPKQTYNKDKWKYICEEILERINTERYSKAVNSYRNDICKFTEDMLGIKLTKCQQALLKMRHEVFSPIIPRRNIYSNVLNMMYKMLFKEDIK